MPEVDGKIINTYQDPDWDFWTGLIAATIMAMAIGVVWIFIHATKVEKELKRPQPTLAEKWREHNHNL